MTIYSSGIALIKNHKIFLVRSYGNNLLYGIPKGRIDENEDSKTAAIREFNEETGILLNESYLEDKPFCIVKTKFKDTVKFVNVYKYVGEGTETFISCNLITEGANKGMPENIDGKWFSYKEALENIYIYQRPLIEKLIVEEKNFKTFVNNNRTFNNLNRKVDK